MSKRSAKCLMLNFSPRVGYSNDAPDRMCEEQNDFHWRGGRWGGVWGPQSLHSPCQWKSFCSSHIRFGASLEYPITNCLWNPFYSWKTMIDAVTVTFLGNRTGRNTFMWETGLLSHRTLEGKECWLAGCWSSTTLQGRTRATPCHMPQLHLQKEK